MPVNPDVERVRRYISHLRYYLINLLTLFLPSPPSDFTLLFTSLTRGVAAIVLREGGGQGAQPLFPSHFFGDKEEDKCTGNSVSDLE